MQRTTSFLIAGMISALALTACPQKKAEKEPPAAPNEPAAADENGAEEDSKEDEAADQKKPEEKKVDKKADKKPAGDDKAEEGGW